MTVLLRQLRDTDQNDRSAAEIIGITPRQKLRLNHSGSISPILRLISFEDKDRKFAEAKISSLGPGWTHTMNPRDKEREYLVDLWRALAESAPTATP